MGADYGWNSCRQDGEMPFEDEIFSKKAEEEENEYKTPEPDVQETQEEISPKEDQLMNESARKIQTKFRQGRSRKALEDNLLEKIKTSKAEENPNLVLKEISLEDFNSKLKSNPYIEPLTNKYSDDLQKIKSNSEEQTFNYGPLQLEDKTEDTSEYNLADWNLKGEMSGKVQSLLADNSYYQGLIKNNLFNGKGIFIKPDGNYYFGDWSNGLSEGEGILNIENDSLYTGSFSNNMKNGFGKEEYPDGTFYEGNFVNNEKVGKGKYTFTDGSFYVGDFKDQKFEGEGKYHWADGREYAGEFKAGQLHGKGTHKWADGSYYQGEYYKGKKNGHGAFYWNNGNSFFSNFINNEPHGAAEFEEKETGNKYQLTFRHGKLICSKAMNEDNRPITEEELNKSRQILENIPVEDGM